MASESHVTHHLRKKSGSGSSMEACEDHEFLVSETQNISLTDTHRIDIPSSLNSVASKGRFYIKLQISKPFNYNITF